MIARWLLLVVIGAGLLFSPAGPKAATSVYSDRSVWASQAGVVGTESYESYAWTNAEGNLLVLGGSYQLGVISYQVPPESALYGIGTVVTRDAPYLSASYLEWQSPAAAQTTLTIRLPRPVTSIGFDFGQFNGASLPLSVTLGNGDTFSLTTNPDSYRFAGFVSDQRFSSLTLSGPAFPVLDNLAWGLGDPSRDAPAVRLSRHPAGIGHVLIIPYFSAQGGNATLLNIVNTDPVRGKAVKVRFRGASNADAIFDFQLFLSPGDVWAANVSEGPNGVPRVLTSDRSCTLPANLDQDFDTSRLNTVDLSGEALANEAREGYVEILTMGDIPPNAETTSLGHAIQHDEHGVAPCTASILASLTQGDTRLLNPTTGLMANWKLINVPHTTTWSGEAIAFEARAQGLAAEGRNLYWPQTATPLTAEQIEANTADPLLLDGTVEAASHDLPDLSTRYTLGAGTPIVQATELSDALAATEVALEYLSDPTIGASTDWIVSQPTRRYYVAVDYAGTTPQDRLVTNYDDHLIYDADYYRSRYGDSVGFGNTVLGNAFNGCKTWHASVTLTLAQFWNREDVSPMWSSPIATDVPPPQPSLCGAVAVLGINSPASAIGADVSRINVTPPGLSDGWWHYYPDVPLVDGWGRIVSVNALTPNLLDSTRLGLPMLAAQFSKATNPAVAPGVSGTFGGVWPARVLQRGTFFVP